MKGPGPNADQLRRILAAGVRVPDHGKLTPWRFIVFEGEGRARMGDILADAWRMSAIRRPSAWNRSARASCGLPSSSEW